MEIKGLAELTAAFAKQPEIAAKHINKAIKRSIIALQAAAIEHVPVDTGTLVGRLDPSFKNMAGALKANTDYAIYVHEGTKPHWPPYSDPNRGVGLWAKRHGIAAFLVARGIARHGTKPHPFFQQAIDEKKDELDANFAAALENITNNLAE